MKRLFEISDEKFRQGPAEIITENSKGFRNVLSKLWPKSALRLCQLEMQVMAQQWLKKEENKIAEEHRQELLEILCGLMQCRTISEAEDTYLEIRNSRSLRATYGNFLRYLTGLWKRREEYCLAWRSPKVRGHTSINSGAVIKALKEKVLRGRRCYNVVHLLDRITSRLEKYLQKRLVQFLSNPFPHTLQNSFLRKIAYLKSADVIQSVDAVTFKVPGGIDPEAPLYTVRMDVGSCECPDGSHGNLCKHQFAVWQLRGVPPSRAQAIITGEDRDWFHQIATGNEKDLPPPVPLTHIQCNIPTKPKFVNAWRHKVRFRNIDGAVQTLTLTPVQQRTPAAPTFSLQLASVIAEDGTDGVPPSKRAKLQMENISNP
ncbi:unnamed protein product [Soboliphyme baturini]|uniref:SWIM-type domain-containing protein n=1 Tax=Soboliphyme baturini TaxID=241478 RepID=A0A183IIH8_9BILA|nr:unnamed protein product [Soboliphyme baturini]